jgi:hypothetical protein
MPPLPAGAGPTTGAPADNTVYRIAEHADICTRIELQLLWRRLIDGVRVNVMNRGDCVVLAGQVRGESEKQPAERIAPRTVGVGQFDNLLQVAPALIDAAETSAHRRAGAGRALDQHPGGGLVEVRRGRRGRGAFTSAPMTASRPCTGGCPRRRRRISPRRPPPTSTASRQ